MNLTEKQGGCAWGGLEGVKEKRLMKQQLFKKDIFCVLTVF